MITMKMRIAAATLAVLSAAGIASASADPWNHHDQARDRAIHQDIRHDVARDRMIRNDIRHDVVRDRMIRTDMHRHYVDNIHVRQVLMSNHYRWIGDPYFVRGHYVVRTYNRFGHIVFVQIDPYSGAFLGEVRL